MKHHLYAGSFVVLSTFFVDPALAQQPCWRGLIQDETTYKSDVLANYALARAVSTESSRNTSAEATVPIEGLPIGGSFSDSRRNQFEENTNIQWNFNEAVSYLSRKVSPEVARAYLQCVKWNSQQGGVKVWTEDFDEDSAVIMVRYDTPPGGQLQPSLDLTIAGAEPVNTLPTQLSSGQSTQFLVRRNEEQKIRVIANAGNTSDSVEIPFVPAIRATTSTRPVTRGPFRFANDGSGRNQRFGACERSTEGWTVRPDSARAVTTMKVGNIDDTTFVRISNQTQFEVCYEGLLRPLSAEGGGDFRFLINFEEMQTRFERAQEARPADLR